MSANSQDRTMGSPYPPGPGRLAAAIYGVVFQLCRVPFMPAMVRRYGDVFSLQAPPYTGRVVVINRPEHVKEVFAGDPRDLHAGESNQVLKPVMGEHSVLLADDAEHARLRRLLMPAFNGASLHGYRDLVANIARAEVDRWNTTTELRALDRMSALTLEVIMRVVFGVTDADTHDRLAPRLRRMVDVRQFMQFSLIFPGLNRVGPWKRNHDNQNEIDALLYAEIDRRRRSPDLSQRTDVLSRLLQAGSQDDSPLSDAEVRDQLITLLLAGQATTAAALAWTLHDLARHGDLQRRAYLAAVEHDDKFLEAALKESLRLHPVIAATVRKLTRDQAIGGWQLPAGTVVSPSIVLAHRRDDSYPDATTYRPDRFLANEVGPNTWLPFGGGVRRCIGAGFSLLEGTVVLREILTRYTLSPPADGRPERVRVRNITRVPKRRARLAITPRSAVAQDQSPDSLRAR